MITVTLFIRAACPECDQARADLAETQAQHPHRLIEIDVDQDPVLKNSYRDTVPMVQVGPYTLRWPFNQTDLRVAIGAAGDRGRTLEQAGDAAYRDRVDRGQTVTGVDRFSYWLSAHYMVIFNLVTLLYVGLPFLAPVLMKAGVAAPARAIYTIYSPLCHQLAFRSFFLFGEQPYYPRELAGVPDVLTYEQVTHATTLDLSQARAFRGNPQLGFKLALCERDIALYGAILLFGLLFSLSGRRIRPLPWYLWILLGLAPIGIDGLSQLTGTLTFLPDWLPVRESTPLLRAITGVLFGFTTAWYLYPLVEETMRETRGILARKLAVAGDPPGKRGQS